MKKLCIAAFLMVMALPAFAQNAIDAPLLSSKRLSFGVRVEYAWWQNNGGSVLVFPFKKEFGLGIPVSYALTARRLPDGTTGPPALAFTARAIYFVDSRITSYALGLNLALYDGGK